MNRTFVSLMLSISLLAAVQGYGSAGIITHDQDEDVQTLEAVIQYTGVDNNEPPVLMQEADQTNSGEIEPPEITELNFDEYIDFQVKKIDLDSSYLSGRFSAYHVTLTNNTPFDLQIVQANIVNGYDGQTAFDLVKHNPLSSLRLRLSYSGMARSALKGAQALVRNKTAKEESTLFTNEIPKEMLDEGETIEFNALVPKGEKPKLFIKYYNPDAKKVYYSYIF